MLLETDKIKCKRLLDRLSDEQLESMQYTLTKRKDGTRDEKIKDIIDYSDTPKELLMRKMIRKDDLFRYLVDLKIGVSTRDKKKTLAQKLLEHWSQEDADVQAQLQHPEQDIEINTVTNMFENLNTASQQQSSQPGAPTASFTAIQLQLDVTQHTSQVYNPSRTVSDVKSEMDESITNYGDGAISQVTRPALQNQVQHRPQNVSILVSTKGNPNTTTVEQRNDPVQISVQSNTMTNIGITNLTSPPTTTTTPPVPKPRNRKTTLRPS